MQVVTIENFVIGAVEQLYEKSPDDFFLLEIGANDGYCCDRMHSFVLENDPNSLFVEPVPCYFKQLKKNYKGLKNASFENCAISSTEGERDIHFIPRERIANEEVRFRLEDQPDLWKEHWAGGLGSFYEGQNNLGCPELKKFQETITVAVKTLEFLFDKYDLGKYKNLVIQTDTEGHDYEILKSFNFEEYEPSIYICEIHCTPLRYPPSHPAYGLGKSLYTNEQVKDACYSFIKKDYTILDSNDLVAVKNSLFPIEIEVGGKKTRLGTHKRWHFDP
tara:strand:+ start:1181 stop:2008 length:828 start_codon:yes stop_codon:yes gene_type:complete